MLEWELYLSTDCGLQSMLVWFFWQTTGLGSRTGDRRGWLEICSPLKLPAISKSFYGTVHCHSPMKSSDLSFGGRLGDRPRNVYMEIKRNWSARLFHESWSRGLYSKSRCRQGNIGIGNCLYGKYQEWDKYEFHGETVAETLFFWRECVPTVGGWSMSSRSVQGSIPASALKKKDFLGKRDLLGMSWDKAYWWCQSWEAFPRHLKEF